MKKKINYKRLAKRYKKYKKRIYTKVYYNSRQEKRYEVFVINYESFPIPTKYSTLYNNVPINNLSICMRNCLVDLIKTDRRKKITNKKYYPFKEL